VTDGRLHVPARDIPLPTSISDEARAVLAQPAVDIHADWPALDDVDGWRAAVAARDAELRGLMTRAADALGADRQDRAVDGTTVYVVTPAGVDDDRVVLDAHGGAFIYLGGEGCAALTTFAAVRLRLPVWGVDYRMPPDHPYPAGLDDCVRSYRALLDERPADRIVVTGTSAGGNLAAALVVRARDEGLPMPAALVLETPEVDLTESGDSFRTNLGVDTVLGSLLPVNRLYAAGEDLTHPYLSPLFADLTGLPPTILTTGTRDLFLSNTVRMHRALRRAGVEAELHVLEAAPHSGFMGVAPEDAELAAEVRRFIDRHCPPA
jgi:epsilon-lactone hydrolase